MPSCRTCVCTCRQAKVILTRVGQGLDALLIFAEPPWPADMQVFELASERIGPVLSPRFARFERLCDAPVEALLGESLLQTTSRPQAWPSWAQQNGIDPQSLRYGQGFEHLYYLLEAAVAGLGIAIAPEPLVIDDLKAGRLAAPWGSVKPRRSWRFGYPDVRPMDGAAACSMVENELKRSGEPIRN